MPITRDTGNLLKEDVDALVNTEGIMGKGIALQFKKAWPEMFKAYEAACKRGSAMASSGADHEGVQRWSNRKSSLFNPAACQECLERGA